MAINFDKQSGMRIVGATRWVEQQTRTGLLPVQRKRRPLPSDDPDVGTKMWLAKPQQDIHPDDIDIVVDIWDGDEGVAPGATGETLSPCQYIWFSDGKQISQGRKIVVWDLGDGVKRIVPIECE